MTTAIATYTCQLPVPTDKTQGPANAKNYKGEKPLWHSLKLLAVEARSPDWEPRGNYDNQAPIVELAELCIWGPKSANGARVCASIWIHSEKLYCSGYAYAGGYGYCKSSHAAYHAMVSAGLGFERDGKTWYFDGAGMSEVETALFALGESLGFDRSNLYVVRGA